MSQQALNATTSQTQSRDALQQQQQQQQQADEEDLFTQHRVPADFPEILRDLSQQVLFQQPADLYRFCADFFTVRLKNREAAAAKASGTTTTFETTGSNPRPFQEMPAYAKDPEEASESVEHSPLPSDDEEDLPPLPAIHSTQAPRGRRTSVSAESMTPGADKSSSSTHEPAQKLSFPKSQAQRDRIAAAIKNNFLFRNLDEEQYAEVLDAMQEKKVPAGEEVITQGGVGDYFYIVETGTLDVFVSKNKQPAVKVTDYTAGGSFGELALMYNAPRAATIKTTSECILWALDRVTFRRILMDTTDKKRRMYEAFMEEVPLLKSLEPYERHKIADALESVTFEDGQVVMKQGDPGDSFYFIVSGEATVMQTGDDGKTSQLSSLKKGDYFGELALLTNKPRAATIQAKGKLRCATLGKKAFDRLLGPALNILKRNTSAYKALAHRKSLKDLVESIEKGALPSNTVAPNSTSA